MKFAFRASLICSLAVSLMPVSAIARDQKMLGKAYSAHANVRNQGFPERRVAGRGYASGYLRGDSFKRGVGYRPLGVGPGLGLVYGIGNSYGNGY